MKSFLTFVLVVASASGVFGADEEEGTPSNVTIRECIELGEPEEIGKLSNPLLNEVSGMVESRRSNDGFWVHNDSGDKLKLYSIFPNGTIKFEVSFEGKPDVSDAIDVEDLAIGPSPTDNDGIAAYLYLGDIGDNNGNRSTLVVYRFYEPDFDNSENVEIKSADYVTITLAGQAGHNFESLFVDPNDPTKLYLVTKNPYNLSDEDEAAYRAKVFVAENPEESNNASKPISMTEIGILPEGVNAPTGASICPEGRIVVILRDANLGALVYVRDLLDDGSMEKMEDLFDREPSCELELKNQTQAEAIAFSNDGGSLYTTSEGLDSPIYKYSVNSSMISAGHTLSTGSLWVTLVIALVVCLWVGGV